MGPPTTENGNGRKDRAILTAREREILSGEADVTDNYYYRVVSGVRKKIERLEDDLELLDEHHSALASELRGAVCDGESTHN